MNTASFFRTFMSIAISICCVTFTLDAAEKSTKIQITKNQITQKVKQILFLAMPMLLVNGIYPNMTQDLLETILGKPSRYNSCYVSADNFQRIRFVIHTLLYFSVASYFWPKALNSSDNVYKH